MGDCQRFYALTEQFVDKVNRLNDVDFVLITGDLTDFGIETEFEYMHETLERLNVPYVTVIGNHDLVYNGSQVFKEMYGSLNFSFKHSDIKFICANTNGREVGFNGTLPNLEWLENEIDSLEQNESFVVVGHVSPKTRDFDSKLKEPFLKMLESDKRFLFLLTGHEHQTFQWKFEDYDVVNINTASPSKKQFAKLKIWKTGYSYEVDAF
jgi:predicted phosphodiesterase